jgi:gas vesicle protein
MGSMAAILLAPRPGRELRRGFAEGGEKLRETTTRTVSELKGSSHDAREAFERAREALTEAVEGLKEATRAMTGKRR